MESKTQNLWLAYVFMAIVCLAPLPLASNRPLAWSALTLALGGTALAWRMFIPAEKEVFTHKYFKWAVFGFFIVILWAIFQMFSPFGVNPLWNMSENALNLDKNIGGSISLNPQAGGQGLLRYLGYACALLLATQLGRNATNTRLILKGFLGASVLYALYGLAVYITNAQTILWMEKWAYEDALTSTFVNRNSYATFAGLGLLTALTFLLKTLRQSLRGLRGKRKLEVLIHVLTTKAMPYLLACFVLAAALLLTHSRGGLAASAIGVLSLLSLRQLNESTSGRKRFSFLPWLGVISIGGLFILMAGDSWLKRLYMLDVGADWRGALYQRTWHAVQDYPWLGSGLGTFEDVFRLYRDDTLAAFEQVRIANAHNTYLENMLELGIPAAFLLSSIIILLVWLCYQGAKTRKQDADWPMLAVAASVLVSLHSFVDFSLEIPAVTLAWLMLLGLGLGQSVSHKESPAPQTEQMFMRRSVAWFGVAALMLGSLYTLDAAKRLHQEHIANALLAKKELPEDQVIQLIEAQPDIQSLLNDGAVSRNAALAEIALADKKGPQSEQGRAHLIRARENLKISLMRNPTDSFNWLRLGYVELLLKEEMKAAKDALMMSVYTAPYNRAIGLYRLSLLARVTQYLTPEEQEVYRHQQAIHRPKIEIKVKP